MSVVEKTIQSYNQGAEKFGERDDWEQVLPFAEEFITRLDGNRVLDAGCGPGHHAAWFTEHGCEVTAIDLSAELVKQARKNAPRATVKEMDIRDLDFDAANFDGVWANAVLFHLTKEAARKAVEELRRVLKPGGVLFISVKKGSGERFVEEKEVTPRFYAFYGEDEFRSLLQDSGFHRVETEIVEAAGATWIDVFAERP